VQWDLSQFQVVLLEGHISDVVIAVTTILFFAAYPALHVKSDLAVLEPSLKLYKN
jgi:hypothetical protein